MTPRQQRRREEHKARKEAYKARKQAEQSAETTAETAAESSIRTDVPRALINKQNAQHSTGPRTKAGKLASSRNSFKHGLYSKKLVIQGEDPADLDALRDDLRREHQPADTTEEILVNELAENYWRLRRMRRYETRVMASETAEEFAQKMALLPLIQRTMASAERAFHKALTTLRQIQKERTKQTESVPRDSKSERHPHENGFVSQRQSAPANSQNDHGFASQIAPQPAPTSIPEPQQHHRQAA